MSNIRFRNLIRPFLVAPLAAVLMASGLARAESDFASGKVRLSVSAGSSTAFNETYFQLGIGAGYYVVDGLELGLDARSWLGGEISIHEVAPSVTYVFNNLGNLKPYGGLLYRRTFIEDRDDRSAYGARGGIFLQSSQNLLVRAGVVAIQHQNCETTPYSDCTEIYPEISAGFYF